MNRAFAAVGAHRPPLAVPETADARSRSRRFDRCADSCSLYPPPAALTGPPLAVPETADARFHSRRFDRCANHCSLYPPPAALAGPPLAVPETADARFHSRRFDRCANPCSLYPPPAALAGVARHAVLERLSGKEKSPKTRRVEALAASQNRF